MNRLSFLLVQVALVLACGAGPSTADDASTDLPAASEVEGGDPCPGYSGLRSCCAVNDPCGLADDLACDCDGACGWDAADCAARCGADGACEPTCPADPDCGAPCACDHARGLCETARPCEAEACACDPDCVAATPCAADEACDPRCPRGADPDCAGSADDGKSCCVPACEGKACGPDGCGGECGACPSTYGCYDGRCLVDDGCGVITDWGCCQGTLAVWCDDGELWQVDCAAEEPAAGCGWDTESGYYCGGSGVDPDGIYAPDCLYGPCTPDCHGKECGGDGCNGNCGDCAEGEVCRSGSCRPE